MVKPDAQIAALDVAIFNNKKITKKLTLSEKAVLARISAFEKAGEAESTQSMANFLGMGKPSVQRLIRNLKARDFVRIAKVNDRLRIYVVNEEKL